MRIKKTSQTTPIQAQIVDGYSESTTDGYSANYVNNAIKDVYSTIQVEKTNKVLNNKPVYRSYISYEHSSVGTYNFNHNLGIETIVSINGSCTIAGQTIASHGFRQLPMVNVSSGNMFGIDTIRENTITTTAVGWNNNHIYLWLEYTKTTD